MHPPLSVPRPGAHMPLLLKGRPVAGGHAVPPPPAGGHGEGPGDEYTSWLQRPMPVPAYEPISADGARALARASGASEEEAETAAVLGEGLRRQAVKAGVPVPVYVDVSAAGIRVQDVLLVEGGDGGQLGAPAGPGGWSLTAEELAASLCADLGVPAQVFEPLLALQIREQLIGMGSGIVPGLRASHLVSDVSGSNSAMGGTTTSTGGEEVEDREGGVSKRRSGKRARTESDSGTSSRS